MEEEDIDNFAIDLTITLARPVSPQYAHVKQRYIKLLKGTNCEKIDLSHLVDHDCRVTFISGTASIGKSVLSKQLAYSWACDSLYTKFRLCIVVECRDVNDFAANEGKKDKSIFDARMSLEQHLPVILIPHFLNSFCCVELLTEAELYCWILYLLLEQYVEEQVPSEERLSEVLIQYSGEVSIYLHRK